MRGGGKLRPATWAEAFAAIRERLNGLAGERIAALAGDLVDCESMVALKELMVALGSPHLDCRQDGAQVDPDVRAGYLFNSGIAGIDQADAMLLIGSNPRWKRRCSTPASASAGCRATSRSAWSGRRRI